MKKISLLIVFFSPLLHAMHIPQPSVKTLCSIIHWGIISATVGQSLYAAHKNDSFYRYLPDASADAHAIVQEVLRRQGCVDCDTVLVKRLDGYGHGGYGAHLLEHEKIILLQAPKDYFNQLMPLEVFLDHIKKERGITTDDFLTDNEKLQQFFDTYRNDARFQAIFAALAHEAQHLKNNDSSAATRNAMTLLTLFASHAGVELAMRLLIPKPANLLEGIFLAISAAIIKINLQAPLKSWASRLREQRADDHADLSVGEIKAYVCALQAVDAYNNKVIEQEREQNKITLKQLVGNWPAIVDKVEKAQAYRNYLIDRLYQPHPTTEQRCVRFEARIKILQALLKENN